MTGGTIAEMGGDPRQATRGVDPRRQQVDVDVEQAQRLTAADIRTVGFEEAIEAASAAHWIEVVMGRDTSLRRTGRVWVTGGGHGGRPVAGRRG